MFAWTGPFIGALIRPLGGMIADKFGGARVTQYISFIMVACALGVAYYMKLAYASATPEEFFVPFLILFPDFVCGDRGWQRVDLPGPSPWSLTGSRPVLCWAGHLRWRLMVPSLSRRFLGEEIKAATPELALYGFAVFYGVCIVINWWFYLRPGAYVKKSVND